MHAEACRIVFFKMDQVEELFQSNDRIMPEHRGALQLYFQSSIFQEDWKL